MSLDPNLSAIAPEECLWYAASAGHSAPDPESTNETERLFAEPQVQRLFAEIEKQVVAAARLGLGPGAEPQLLIDEVPKLLKTLAARPFAAYVADVQQGENSSVEVDGAFVLNAGGQRQEFEASLAKVLTLVTAKGVTFTDDPADGVAWRRVATPPQAPAVRFGWKDDYFIVAVGARAPADVVKRMGGEAPPWLTQLRTEHPIEREQTIGYLNVTGILERARPLVQKTGPPDAWAVIERLGLTSIRALHGMSGYDEKGCTNVAHLVTDGQRPGILAFIPHEPLAIDDLDIVPKDAMLAMALRIDPSEALRNAIDLAEGFTSGARQEFEQGLIAAQSHLGINIREDVVASVGDRWVAFLPGGDLMSSWLNAAAAVQVKDATKLRAAVEKLVNVAKQELARAPGQVAIAESTVGDVTIYSLQFVGQPMPISPSWCVSDEWVVGGLLPQAVQSVLERSAEDSLASVDALRETLNGSDSPAALFYQDTPQFVRTAYPWVQMGVQVLASQLREQGMVIDATALPTADTIVKHLRPSVSTLAHKEDGFHFATRGSMPGGGNAASALPVAAALILPAVQSARQAARDSQEMNNLRQIALAYLNYHDATGAFPTDIYDDAGKPLLSWRVRLLPYMEHNAFHSQFHLDEPWDSEHNRALIEQMPAVFQSPAEPLPAGKTRYVALKGQGTVFPGNERLRLAGITDGTSNTIFVVQSAPSAAVEWTRPADIEFDEAKPFNSLGTPRGVFLAAFCDGSVRRLSLAIGAEAMKAVASRSGEEVIDHNMLAAPPAPQLYQPEDRAENAIAP